MLWRRHVTQECLGNRNVAREESDSDTAAECLSECLAQAEEHLAHERGAEAEV